MNALLETKNLRKAYKMGEVEVIALDGVSLDIMKGEFVSIVGPSGSGKSTLMNMLGILDSPTSGEVYLENKEISKLSEERAARLRGKKIGFVFQTFNLIPYLTALDNVSLPMVFQKRSSESLMREAKELLGKVGLSKRETHKPSEMSGGERQRVSIARALANSPEILFADEPTGNLDSKTGKGIIELLVKLNKDENKTLIIVTHDILLANMADRKIVMKDGKIVKEVKK